MPSENALMEPGAVSEAPTTRPLSPTDTVDIPDRADIGDGVGRKAGSGRVHGTIGTLHRDLCQLFPLLSDGPTLDRSSS